MNDEMKGIMLEILEESVDDILKDSGFVRKKNSLLYNKKIGSTKQKIIMCFNSYYASFMLISPHFSVGFPKINQIAREMTENDPIFGRVVSKMKNVTIQQPIQLIAKSGTWVLGNGKEKKEDLVPKIDSFLIQYVVPLLADLECENDLINLYEKQDKRVKMGDIEHIYVASAYILEKEYTKGFNVLESQFKTLGRKQHATIFRYIENLL